MRWRPILCLWGLLLFGLLTYASVQGNREMRHGRHGRYFWWGSVRLDSDPLDKHPTLEPCTQGQEGDLCMGSYVHLGGPRIARKSAGYFRTSSVPCRGGVCARNGSSGRQ